jgi:hypothetical protein
MVKWVPDHLQKLHGVLKSAGFAINHLAITRMMAETPPKHLPLMKRRKSSALCHLETLVARAIAEVENVAPALGVVVWVEAKADEGEKMAVVMVRCLEETAAAQIVQLQLVDEQDDSSNAPTALKTLHWKRAIPMK